MLTRRHLQIGLGVAWLLDAALQYLPYVFSAAFPRTEIAGAADGQPAVISASAHWAAHLMAAAPMAINAAFATVQLLLGIGLLYRRTRTTSTWTSCRWTAIAAWALVWCGSALLQVLPAQRDSWWLPVPLAAVLLLVGVAPVAGRRAARVVGALVGAVLGLTFWIFGQSFDDVWTVGLSTDPSSREMRTQVA